MKNNTVLHTNLVTFAAHAHAIGPLALMRELMANGTSASHAWYAVDQLFGDAPEFCPHCHQEIVEVDDE